MHYCSQGEGNWRTTVLKERETGALLFSRRGKLVHYCSQGEGNWRSTDLRRIKLAVY